MDILPQLIINSIIAGAVYTMIALGFSLVFSVTKFFNLAHGSLAAVGGYAVFYFTQTLGWGLYASAGLGMLSSAMCGLLMHVLVFEPLVRRRASNMILLVSSLGIFTVIQGVLAILFSSNFQTLSHAVTNPGMYRVGGAVFTGVHLAMIICSLVLVIVISLLSRYSKLGKSVLAISDDEEVAKIIGIDTQRVIRIIFFVGSAIAGIAGILIGLDTGIEPTMGLPLLLKGVVAAIIGGIGNIYGAVLGAFVLGFVENFGIWKISGEWKDVIAFGLLILFLIGKPYGLLTKK